MVRVWINSRENIFILLLVFHVRQRSLWCTYKNVPFSVKSTSLWDSDVQYSSTASQQMELLCFFIYTVCWIKLSAKSSETDRVLHYVVSIFCWHSLDTVFKPQIKIMSFRQIFILWRNLSIQVGVATTRMTRPLTPRAWGLSEWFGDVNHMLWPSNRGDHLWECFPPSP